MAAALCGVRYAPDATVVQQWICSVCYGVWGSAAVGFARPPRTVIIALSESGWATLSLCLTQAEKDYVAGVATGEVSFVLEWETKGAMASDWDEVGEEASHGDEQEDGEEKGEREEEPHEEEATGTLEKRRNKEVRKKRKKGKGMEKREIKKNKGKGNE
jgi:hypothetical protein